MSFIAMYEINMSYAYKKETALMSVWMSHLVILFLCFYPLQGYSELLVKYSDKDGLPQVIKSQGTIAHFRYVGWQQDWKWDAPVVKNISNNVSRADYTLNFRKQGVESRVAIEANKSGLKYTYHHQFTKSLPKTIGGGIEFTLDLQPQIQSFGAREPVLLPNNGGWSWEFSPGKVLEVIFSPGIANVYFEKGNKSRIRAMFFGGRLSLGSDQTIMQVNVPEGSSVASISGDDQTRQRASWFNKALNPVESFIDLSGLNEKPAGNRGFVKAVGDRYEFSDGTQARFFGANVQAYSLFTADKSLIKQHARRLARLGFNLVRLHHHDSPWVNPSLIMKGEATQEIDEKALDSYFWWVKCLRDEGIYTWVDLQVERPWRKGDKVPGWSTDLEPKSKKGMNVAKGFVYLNKRMQALTKKFNKELLTRINPYTKLALKDDPAVMSILITNENDLTRHFGNAFLKDKKRPYHQYLFDKEVEDFADKFDFPAYKVRETWKPGPAKYLLNDLEARFNADMINDLRALGVKVPISTTNLWGSNGFFSLPSLTTGDIVDTHAYADMGIFRKSPLQKDPRYQANFLHWLGQGQVVDKPFTVTEYNVGERSDLENAYIPTISMASMSAFQGWDAIMLYGYSQDGFKAHHASPWSSYRHPAIMGVIPAMALLYRERHVAPARQTVVLAPGSHALFSEELSPKTSMAIRTTLEQHRMMVAMPKTDILPWLKPSVIGKDAIVVRDLNKSLLPANQDYIESDTGEMRRSWRKGIMTVNTPMSQLAMGRIGDQVIELDNTSIKSETPEAAIIFTSLDKKPVKDSERILLSAVARVAKVKVKWKSSYISEPVKASLTLTSAHEGLRLVALRPDGSEGRSLPLKRNANGKYSFLLSDKDDTHWYLITK